MDMFPEALLSGKTDKIPEMYDWFAPLIGDWTCDYYDEPLGYDLQQFLIDQQYQNKGYGSQALQCILDELRKEGRYDHVELCVKKADTEAIRLYEKHGFIDPGYIDEDLPDSLNMICYLTKKDL